MWLLLLWPSLFPSFTFLLVFMFKGKPTPFLAPFLFRVVFPFNLRSYFSPSSHLFFSTPFVPALFWEDVFFIPLLFSSSNFTNYSLYAVRIHFVSCSFVWNLLRTSTLFPPPFFPSITAEVFSPPTYKPLRSLLLYIS